MPDPSPLLLPAEPRWIIYFLAGLFIGYISLNLIRFLKDLK